MFLLPGRFHEEKGIPRRPLLLLTRRLLRQLSTSILRSRQLFAQCAHLNIEEMSWDWWWRPRSELFQSLVFGCITRWQEPISRSPHNSSLLMCEEQLMFRNGGV